MKRDIFPILSVLHYPKSRKKCRVATAFVGTTNSYQGLPSLAVLNTDVIKLSVYDLLIC
jgi:hypothetical protein